MNKKWLTVREAAAYFGLKTQTLYSLAARGRLPAKSVLRLGRQLRINVQRIEENGNFLNGHR
jgi:excisionase family DNA binding protein